MVQRVWQPLGYSRNWRSGSALLHFDETAAQDALKCLDFIWTLQHVLLGSCEFDVNVMSSPYIGITRDHIITVKLIYRDALYEGAFRLGLGLIHLFQLWELLTGNYLKRQNQRQAGGDDLPSLCICATLFTSLLPLSPLVYTFLPATDVGFGEPRSVPQALQRSGVASLFYISITVALLRWSLWYRHSFCSSSNQEKLLFVTLKKQVF